MKRKKSAKPKPTLIQNLASMAQLYAAFKEGLVTHKIDAEYNALLRKTRKEAFVYIDLMIQCGLLSVDIGRYILAIDDVYENGNLVLMSGRLEGENKYG